MGRYADATYVASRGFEQPAVLTRNASGLALTFHATRLVWAPALYKYTSGPYVIKEGRIVGKQWTLCIMDNVAVIAPQAGSDVDVQVIPDRNLTTVLTGARLNAANDWLANTDFGVTATSGQTVKQLLEAILIALNNGASAVDEL